MINNNKNKNISNVMKYNIILCFYNLKSLKLDIFPNYLFINNIILYI